MVTTNVNLDGYSEIEDDEIFQKMREYPHRNPQIFRKTNVCFSLTLTL
jgi:hypothetical protein